MISRWRTNPAVGFLLLVLAPVVSLADVTLDGSIPGTGQIAKHVNANQGVDYRIPSSAGVVAGKNLFESFGLFSIETGGSATFTNDPHLPISNIVARVTGGFESRIDGKLAAENFPGADLYLLNPAGVIFGAGASLSLPAGLHVSTAEGLDFTEPDGKISTYSATPHAGEFLSMAAPAAFGFIGPSAGTIAVAAGLAVQINGPLELTANAIDVSGTLSVIGSAATLVGNTIDVSGPLTVIGPGATLVGDTINVGGHVSVLGQYATLRARDLISIQPTDETSSPASVMVFGTADPTLDLEAETVRIAGFGTMVDMAASKSHGSGRIDVKAATLEIDHSARLSATAGAVDGPKGPSINVTAHSVKLEDGGQIWTQTGIPDVPAGDVTIDASGSVAISGRTADGQEGGISTASTSHSGANAGNIDIRTPSLTLSDEGVITARNSGMETNGRAGNIHLDVGTLSIQEGSRIEVNAGDEGVPGTLSVHASDSVSISGGVALDGPDPQRSRLSATSNNQGGGLIEVDTPLLTLGENGLIDGRSDLNSPGNASTISLHVGSLIAANADITVTSQGSGRAGIVDVVAADQVRLTDANLESETTSDGGGGQIHVIAPLLVVEKGGTITTSADQPVLGIPGNGPGGDIDLDIGRLQLLSGGQVLAMTRGDGTGGHIAIHASDGVALEYDPGDDSGHPTAILARADGNGPAGQILIDTPQLHVGEYSRIESSTTGDSGDAEHPVRTGNAGDVRIIAEDMVEESHAVIGSSTTGRAVNSGNAGTVELDVGTLRINGSGVIQASTNTQGDGGSVIVRASRSITEQLGNDGHFSNISSNADGSTGNGGSVLVETPQLALLDGAGIGASSQSAGNAGSVTVRAGSIHLTNGSEIASDANGTGHAGPVQVDATGSLVVEGSNAAQQSGIVTRSSGPGAGGSIAVSAQDLALRDGGTVSASSTGTGNAGDVSIVVAQRFDARNARVTTSASQADGGNIQLQVGDRATLQGSQITADVNGGHGGNIVAQAASLILQQSDITARAGTGEGGTIRIVAEVVIRSQDSIVSAAAGAAGIDGTVSIETPDHELSTKLVALPAEFVDAVTLLHERCAAHRGATASFVVADTTPAAAPTDLVPVDVADHDDGQATRVALLLEPVASDDGPAWHITCGG